MPRRKPSSPTAAPTYCESRLPAVTTSTTLPTLASSRDRDVHDRRHVRAAEQRPRERVPQRGRHARPRDRLVPLVPRRAPFALRAAHRARRRGAPCPAARSCRARTGACARRSCGATDSSHAALDAGPPRGGDHDRDREQREEHEHRARPMTSSTSVTASRTIQPTVENSDMNRWSSANTWSRSTDEPVEILGPLVVLDGRDRRLQRRDVGFERDRDLVAESPLRPVEHDSQEPRRGRRRRQPERGDRRCDSRSCWSNPSARNLSHNAISASGNAITTVIVNARSRPRGSAR